MKRQSNVGKSVRKTQNVERKLDLYRSNEDPEAGKWSIWLGKTANKNGKHRQNDRKPVRNICKPPPKPVKYAPKQENRTKNIDSITKKIKILPSHQNWYQKSNLLKSH